MTELFQKAVENGRTFIKLARPINISDLEVHTHMVVTGSGKTVMARSDARLKPEQRRTLAFLCMEADEEEPERCYREIMPKLMHANYFGGIVKDGDYVRQIGSTEHVDYRGIRRTDIRQRQDKLSKVKRALKKEHDDTLNKHINDTFEAEFDHMELFIDKHRTDYVKQIVSLFEGGSDAKGAPVKWLKEHVSETLAQTLTDTEAEVKEAEIALTAARDKLRSLRNQAAVLALKDTDLGEELTDTLRKMAADNKLFQRKRFPF